MPTRRAPAAVTAALAVAALLSGCSTSSPVGVVVTRTAEPAAATASAPPSPTPTPSGTVPPPTQDPAAATPVRLKCKQLVPTELVQAFAATYEQTEDYEPEPGSWPAKVAALNGKVCSWTNPESERTIEVAVAKPSEPDLRALKNDLVARSNSVPTYGEEAYFSNEDAIGEVNAFHEDVWIVAVSADFFEPGDATAIVKAAGAAAEDAVED